MSTCALTQRAGLLASLLVVMAVGASAFADGEGGIETTGLYRWQGVPSGDFDDPDSWEYFTVPINYDDHALFLTSATYTANFRQDEDTMLMRMEDGDATFYGTGGPTRYRYAVGRIEAGYVDIWAPAQLTIQNLELEAHQDTTIKGFVWAEQNTLLEFVDTYVHTEASPGGRLTVTGAGANASELSCGQLFVGYGGGSPGENGELEVMKDAELSCNGLTVADSQTDRGEVYVNGLEGTGAKAQLHVPIGGTTIGNSGWALLQVKGGATADCGLVSGSVVLGNQNTGTGLVEVTGADSTFIARQSLIIGDGGYGELKVTDGAQAESGNASDPETTYVGQDYGGTGKVYVDHADSEYTVHDLLFFGDSGLAEGFIRYGGKMTVNDAMSLGRLANGDGRLTVEDTDSKLDAQSDLYVGGFGNGELTVQDGATADSGNMNVAMFDGSTGTVTVQGNSTVNVTGDCYVGGWIAGEGGEGHMVVEAGSTLNVSGTYKVWPGSSVSASGDAATNDLGTSATINGWLVCDTLDIPAGAVCTMGPSSVLMFNHVIGMSAINAHHLEIGTSTGASGSADVTIGNGQSLNLTGDLTVGSDVAGSLLVQGTGSVSHKNLYVGRYVGGDGQITANHADVSWSCDGWIHVGYEGLGTVTLESGADYVQNGSGRVGYLTGSVGEINVRHAGSSIDISGWLLVGDQGFGSLTVESQGHAEIGGLYVGNGVASGVVLVHNPGSSLDTEQVRVGTGGIGHMWVLDSATLTTGTGISGIGTTATGEGYLLVHTGATWNGQGDVYVGGMDSGRQGTGLLDIQDGAISLPGRLIHVYEGSMLQGHGSVVCGSVVNEGEVHATGLLSCDSNYGQDAGASLTLALTADEGPERLHVVQVANIAGTLRVYPVVGFQPEPGITQVVMSSAQPISGTFSEIEGPILNISYFDYQVVVELTYMGDADKDGDVDIEDLSLLAASWGECDKSWGDGDFTGDGCVTIEDLSLLAASWGAGTAAAGAPVPEPAALSLLALGGLALLRRRRGR